MAISTEIDASEAKTHLPDLLRKVQAGQQFTITHRGEPVAELQPYGTASSCGGTHAAGHMKEFMGKVQASVIDIKTLIKEGRD